MQPQRSYICHVDSGCLSHLVFSPVIWEMLMDHMDCGQGMVLVRRVAGVVVVLGPWHGQMDRWPGLQGWLLILSSLHPEISGHSSGVQTLATTGWELY